MRFILTLILFVALGGTTRGQTLRVAVAANAQYVLKALQADFKSKTGIKIEVISGSSGKLTAQIKNGAPYDMFLSADMDMPLNLYKAGFGLNQPKIYALGSLIICSTTNLDLKKWPKLLLQSSIPQIAVANPRLAPYGQAAESALRYYKLWEPIQKKLVFGESIAQVNTYLTTGVVKVGFTTEALIYERQSKNNLKWERVDPNIYSPIKQGVIILTQAKKSNYKQAMRFYQYLFSSAAQQILQKNGYQIP